MPLGERDKLSQYERRSTYDQEPGACGRLCGPTMDIPAHKQSFPRRFARTAAGFFKSEHGPSNGSVLDFASTACHDPLADQIQSSFQSETSIYFILFIYLFIYLWITQ